VEDHQSDAKAFFIRTSPSDGQLVVRYDESAPLGRREVAEHNNGHLLHAEFSSDHFPSMPCPRPPYSQVRKRHADRQLAFAANRPCQNQVGDIGTRDDENQPRRCEQHKQQGPG
jgi:hypothetical protein